MIILSSNLRYYLIAILLTVISIACNKQSKLSKSEVICEIIEAVKSEETVLVNYDPEKAKEDSLSWEPWSYSWWSNDWLYDSNNKWIRDRAWYNTNNGRIVFNENKKIYPNELMGKYKKHLGFHPKDSLIGFKEKRFIGKFKEQSYTIRFEPDVFSPLNLKLFIKKDGSIHSLVAKIPNTKVINAHIQSKSIISAEKAVKIAMDYTNAPSYVHLIDENRLNWKNKRTTITLPQPYLYYIFIGKQYRLYYQFILSPILDVENLEIDAIHSYKIDAQTGQVILGERVEFH